MAKKKTSKGQMDLIDVNPKNVKEIIQTAREYREAESQRIKLLRKEVELKNKLLEQIEKADLQRLPNGQIKFKSGGFIISVTPRDQLIKIQEEKKKNKKKSMEQKVETEEEQFEG